MCEQCCCDGNPLFADQLQIVVHSAAVSHLPVTPSPSPPTNLASAGTVDTAVIIGVVVAVVIVILILILAVFIIVLVYMKRRDTSESRVGRCLEATGWERGRVQNAVMSCGICKYMKWYKASLNEVKQIAFTEESLSSHITEQFSK